MLRLEQIMNERKMTARELAELSNMSPVSISNILTGKSSPKVETITKFAQVLNVPVSALFTEKERKIQLIINDELHTFYSLAELKAFLEG